MKDLGKDLMGLSESLKEISLHFMQDKDETYKDFSEKIKEVSEVMMHFFNESERMKEIGIDVPQNVITAQLENIVEGLGKKDSMLLADTLQYEILPSLEYFYKVLEEIKRESPGYLK